MLKILSKLWRISKALNHGIDIFSMELLLLVISENKRKALESFVKALKERYGGRIHKIILFGSSHRIRRCDQNSMFVILRWTDCGDLIRAAFNLMQKHKND